MSTGTSKNQPLKNDRSRSKSKSMNEPVKNFQNNDLQIKIDAFRNDFKLPLNGAEVHISSLRGGVDVANGYERVIADGESLWLELSEEQIFRNNFKMRWRTKSRLYYVMNGVTLHKQLVDQGVYREES